MIDFPAAARRLDEAALHARPITQLSAERPFSLPDAYAIQRQLVDLRVQRGEKIIGIKLGFTSRAKMIQMNVDSLIWGWLTDKMLHEEGGRVDLSKFVHPRVEPKVCFMIRRDIDRPLTLLEAANWVEAVAPAIEIIDSRYDAFRSSLEDVVADNCSAAGLLVGAWTTDFERLGNAGVILRYNGREVQIGSTAAILGAPLRSVVQASQLVADTGVVLPAGSLIMAGAATAAHPLTPHVHVQCMVHRIGQVEFTTY